MKILATAILFFISANISFAQMPQRKFYWGVKIGGNLANQQIKGTRYEVSNDPLFLFSGGAFFEIPAAKKFVVQPELIYENLGSKYKMSRPSVFTVARQSVIFSQLSIPVLAKVHLDKGFSTYIGPQVSYLLDAGPGKEFDPFFDTPPLYKKDFKPVNFSGVIGVEYMRPKGFLLALRYQHSLNNVAKEHAQIKSVTNNAFTFSIGARLY